MIRSDHDGHLRVIYESPQEFIDEFLGYDMRGSHAKEYAPDKRFCPYTWEESVYQMTHGWEEGVRTLDTKIAQLKGREQYEINIGRDVVGDYFDIGLVLTGQPESWYSLDAGLAQKEELTLVVNDSFNCDVSDECVANRGAVICDIIDKLRTRYFLEVVLADRTINCPGKWRSGSIIKLIEIDTQNYYSRSMMAFFLASTGYFRRICFAFLEKVNTDREPSPYGRSMNVNIASDYKAGRVFEIPTIGMDDENSSYYSTIEKAQARINKLFTLFEEASQKLS